MCEMHHLCSLSAPRKKKSHDFWFLLFALYKGKKEKITINQDFFLRPQNGIITGRKNGHGTSKFHDVENRTDMLSCELETNIYYSIYVLRIKIYIIVYIVYILINKIYISERNINQHFLMRFISTVCFQLLQITSSMFFGALASSFFVSRHQMFIQHFQGASQEWPHKFQGFCHLDHGCIPEKSSPWKWRMEIFVDPENGASTKHQVVVFWGGEILVFCHRGQSDMSRIGVSSPESD